MRLARCLVAATVVLGVLGGCEGTNPFKDATRIFQREGKPQLQAGIKQYEEARYTPASASFQAALNAGLNNADQVTAHKYLAFNHCVQGRERQCRAHFSTALELDPSFELAPAEAGHPLWGPVFRSVKAKR